MDRSHDSTELSGHANFAVQGTPENALRAIEDAFAILALQGRAAARLSDLAYAIDAFAVAEWAVAFELAEASTIQNAPVVDTAQPEDVARSWEELERDFDTVRNPDSPLAPVVATGLKIVGWTSAAPHFVDFKVRHPEAERLVGGPIAYRRVRLVAARDIAKARGGQRARGSWECYAL